MPVINFTPGGFNFFVTAEMRAYMQAFHDALLDAGLEQTEDTGQLDIATAEAASGTQSGSFAYQYAPLLYKWPGTGDYPDVFIWIAWRIANRNRENTGNVPCPIVSIGSGTSGDGVLTGVSLPAMPSGVSLQNSYTFVDSQLPGVIAVDDDFLSICVNPGQHSSNVNHRWGLPFLCIERQENGDYHCTTVTIHGDIRSTPSPTATVGIRVVSCIEGAMKDLPVPCAFIDGPTTINGEPVIQKVYRHDRDDHIAEFSPLVAIPHTTALWATVDVDMGDHMRMYMSCGPDTGNRISTTVPNTWVPAMRLA